MQNTSAKGARQKNIKIIQKATVVQMPVNTTKKNNHARVVCCRNGSVLYQVPSFVEMEMLLEMAT